MLCLSNKFAYTCIETYLLYEEYNQIDFVSSSGCESEEADDSDSTSTNSGVQPRRSNIIWAEKDMNAPEIQGSDQLKAVTRSCGLLRVSCNNLGEAGP
jgi:hypothetical protein